MRGFAELWNKSGVQVWDTRRNRRGITKPQPSLLKSKICWENQHGAGIINTVLGRATNNAGSVCGTTKQYNVWRNNLRRLVTCWQNDGDIRLLRSWWHKFLHDQEVEERHKLLILFEWQHKRLYWRINHSGYSNKISAPSKGELQICR